MPSNASPVCFDYKPLQLFRDGFLSASELEDRLLKLVRLQAGEIKPVLSQ